VDSELHKYRSTWLSFHSSHLGKKRRTSQHVSEGMAVRPSVLTLAVDPDRFLWSVHGVTGFAESEFREARIDDAGTR
jgi:hypothetical protein